MLRFGLSARGIILMLVLAVVLLMVVVPVSYGTDGSQKLVCRGVLNNARLIKRLKMMGDVTYSYLGTGPDPVKFNHPTSEVFNTLCYGSDEEFEKLAIDYMRAVLDAAQRGMVIIEPSAFKENPIFNKYRLYKEYDVSAMKYVFPIPKKEHIGARGISYDAEYVTLYAPLRLGGVRFEGKFTARLGASSGTVEELSVSSALVGHWGIGTWTDSDTYGPCSDPCSSEPEQGTWVKIYRSSGAVCDLSDVTGSGSFGVAQVHHLVEWHVTPSYIIGGTMTLARKPLIKVSFQPVSSSYGYWRVLKATHMADEGWCN